MTFPEFFYSQFFVTPAVPTASFAGQTIIVTGANSGLGKEASRHFARLGASKLIFAVRNTKSGAEAKAEIESSTRCSPNVIEVWPLDLESYASIKSFADRASQLPRLDVLLNNAGVLTNTFTLVEGHERQVTVNAISTFYLSLLLLPKLKASAKEFSIKPRLVIVSSETHTFIKFPEWKEPQIFNYLDNKATAKMADRYPASKLLGILAIRQIAPQLEGSGVILNMLNPGFCYSGLGREVGLPMRIQLFFLGRPTEKGSRTLVAAAAAGPESHGKYMNDGVVSEHRLSAFVRSEDGKKASEKVWKELSAILEGIQPGITKNISN